MFCTAFIVTLLVSAGVVQSDVTTPIDVTSTETINVTWLAGNVSTVGTNQSENSTGPYDCQGGTVFNLAVDIRAKKDYVIIIFGLIGNAMSLFVNARKMFKFSSSYYMTILAIADSATILIWGVRYLHGLNSANTGWGQPACKIVQFLLYFSRAFAVNVIVLMTIERTLIVLFPLRLQHQFTVRNAAITLALVAVFFICFHAVLFKYGIEMPYFGLLQCLIDRDEWWATFEVVTSIFLPMVILVICNLIIIVKMKGVADKQEEMTNDASKSGRARKQFIHITIQTLTVSITFVILTIMLTVYYIPDTPINWNTYSQWSPEGSELRCWWDMFTFLYYEVAKMLYALNHAINGYIYCLFSRMFRQELVRNVTAVFCPGRLKKAKRSTSGTAMTSMTTHNQRPVVSTVS